MRKDHLLDAFVAYNLWMIKTAANYNDSRLD